MHMGDSPPSKPGSRNVPVASRDQASLAAAIAEGEERLRRAEVERAQAAARVAALRAKLDAPDDGQVTLVEATPVEASQSAREKVKLFRELFRGREDLYLTHPLNSRPLEGSRT
jgi:hypothetical protein